MSNLLTSIYFIVQNVFNILLKKICLALNSKRHLFKKAFLDYAIPIKYIVLSSTL